MIRLVRELPPRFIPLVVLVACAQQPIVWTTPADERARPPQGQTIESVPHYWYCFDQGNGSLCRDKREVCLSTASHFGELTAISCLPIGAAVCSTAISAVSGKREEYCTRGLDECQLLLRGRHGSSDFSEVGPCVIKRTAPHLASFYCVEVYGQLMSCDRERAQCQLTRDELAKEGFDGECAKADTAYCFLMETPANTLMEMCSGSDELCQSNIAHPPFPVRERCVPR